MIKKEASDCLSSFFMFFSEKEKIYEYIFINDTYEKPL